MQLTFLGKETSGGQSPTLYATDQDTFVIQGWIVADPTLVALLDLPDYETIVEVPPRLMTHLAKCGLDGPVRNWSPPIVQVKENGNYVIRGTRMVDPDALAQMDIPDHEACIEIPRANMRNLISEN